MDQAPQQHPASQPATQSQLDDLTQQAKQLADDVKKAGDETRDQLDAVDKQITDSETNIKGITDRLDTADKAAGDELDDVILEEARDLAED